MATLVLAADGDAALRDTARLVAAARKLGAPVEVAVLAGDAEAGRALAEAAARLAGVEQVWLAADERLDGLLAEPCAALLYGLAREREYQRIIGAMSAAHRDVLGRLAGLLDAPALTDVIAIDDARAVQRPMYAGDIVATVGIEAEQAVLLLRTTAFDEEAEQAQAAAPVAEWPVPEDLPAPVEVLAWEEGAATTAGGDLQHARLVLGMGRGAADEQTRALLLQLAQRLGAAVAATRMVVDEGLAPNDWQVGQTGKRIAPDLYMAFGISGAHQHLAGIADAGMIVAVNNDAEAPIFRAADVGLVADARVVLQALLERLPEKAG